MSQSFDHGPEPKSLSTHAAGAAQEPLAQVDQAVRVLTFERRGPAGRQLHIRVAGDVDMDTAPTLAEALDRATRTAAAERDVVEIVIDLRTVRFLSAAGLTELVRAHERCRHDEVPMCVVADQPAVTRPLGLTGLDRVLDLRTEPDPAPENEEVFVDM